MNATPSNDPNTPKHNPFVKLNLLSKTPVSVQEFTMYQIPQSLHANCKPNEIRRHHHEHVRDGAYRAQVPVKRFATHKTFRRDQLPRDRFRQDEEDNHPSPRQQLKAEVVPQRHERESDHHPN